MTDFGLQLDREEAHPGFFFVMQMNRLHKHITTVMKLVIAGPPRSGKSCFREGLKQAIRAIPGSPYPYIITGCPDGEGAWFQETVNSNPELAAACKLAYKSKFTPEFVRRVSESVANCQLPLTVIDIGGIPSAENEAICASADTCMILAGDLTKIPVWREFCRKVGLRIVAELYSDYNGHEDHTPTTRSDGVLVGSVHHLERGEPVADRPTIRFMAEWLVNATK